jgi:hypothetical protein
VTAMKKNSHSKAVQAFELADNLKREVIEPFYQIKDQQEKEAFSI